MEALLTAKDLAKILRYTELSIYNLASTRPHSLPPAVRLGRSLRWHPKVVESWLEQKAGISTNSKIISLESQAIQKKRGRPTKGEAAAKAARKASGGKK